MQRALFVIAERAQIFVGVRGAEIFGTRRETILERDAESFASAQRNFFYERATNIFLRIHNGHFSTSEIPRREIF